jgi:translation initiation factor IF-3
MVVVVDKNRLSAFDSMPSASNKCEPVSKILTTGTNTHTQKKVPAGNRKQQKIFSVFYKRKINDEALTFVHQIILLKMSKRFFGTEYLS